MGVRELTAPRKGASDDTLMRSYQCRTSVCWHTFSAGGDSPTLLFGRGLRPSCLREPSICGHEALDHRHDQFRRCADRFAGLPRQRFCIGDKVAVHGSRDFDHQLHRRVIGKGSGPAPVLFRSGAHVRRLFVRRPRGFSNPRLNVGGADCRSR